MEHEEPRLKNLNVIKSSQSNHLSCVMDPALGLKMGVIVNTIDDIRWWNKRRRLERQSIDAYFQGQIDEAAYRERRAKNILQCTSVAERLIPIIKSISTASEATVYQGSEKSGRAEHLYCDYKNFYSHEIGTFTDHLKLGEVLKDAGIEISEYFSNSFERHPVISIKLDQKDILSKIDKLESNLLGENPNREKLPKNAGLSGPRSVSPLVANAKGNAIE